METANHFTHDAFRTCGFTPSTQAQHDEMETSAAFHSIGLASPHAER
jgi:hypothetical protein